MKRRAWSLALSAILLGSPLPLALAQDGGATAAPPPEPSTPPPATSAAPPASGAAASEGEAEEPDHTPTQPTPPKAAPVVRVPVVVKDGMVRVPGGRFTMGSSDRSAPANERPARVVVVNPFWIDRTEVTVGMYKACVEKGACPKPARSSTSCTYDAGDPQLPISCVHWTSAKAYCAAVGRRLPREVEWEFAARGTLAFRYPWGAGGSSGCYAAATLAGETTQRSCSGKRPWKVGAHPGGASPFGVVDMSGNVEEWVADWYVETGSDLSPPAGASHVLRGGGWLTVPSLARTTSRNWGSAREAGPNVGFRCARDD